MVLIGGSAAYAADNQADWATTLNVKLALLTKLGTDSLHVDVDDRRATSRGRSASARPGSRRDDHKSVEA
jgi:hypothetical protein